MWAESRNYYLIIIMIKTLIFKRTNDVKNQNVISIIKIKNQIIAHTICEGEVDKNEWSIDRFSI